MLSSQDEAGKSEFRSEKIFYHSVHSNSFFFPTVLSGEGLDRYHYQDVSIQPFIKKKFFSPVEKNLGMFMWRVILVILGMFIC